MCLIGGIDMKLYPKMCAGLENSARQRCGSETGVFSRIAMGPCAQNTEGLEFSDFLDTFF